uniref:Leucine-rich repeat-containing N-terminal plant-type domain-containing protein n=1 Tax=Pseudictyota dubia TaxID=2749911 RepID=A0A7R9WJ53_9STRA
MEGNQITSVPKELCKKKDMMRGDVKHYGCDAILCKPGTASLFGRQNSTETECTPCDMASSATFWGSTSCGTEADQNEVDPTKPDQYLTLALLYDTCGGDNWVKKSNWKEKDVSVCKWHGISCNEQELVHAIRLGSNNLVGTPPQELFDLPHLKWLWLHSNPVQFSFSNIGNARELIELRLDSTGLTSVEGLGDARSIQILDLRFNQLLGPFPEEILQLKTLEVLSLADNDLGGQLPDVAGLVELKTLRLGSNSFSGSLPSFESSSQLRALDLSQNELVGSIPSSFLEAVGIDRHVELNLASNRLTGTVPVELDRFREMTLYLRDNRITSLPNELCDRDNANWNNGDVGQYSCDAILCPPGTFNKLGRQKSQETPCGACDISIFFGQVNCNTALSSSGWSLAHKSAWVMLSSFVVFCTSV